MTTTEQQNIFALHKEEELTFYRYYFVNYILTDKITEDEGLEILEKILQNNLELWEVLNITKCGIKKLNYTIKNKYNHGIYYTSILKIKDDHNLKTTNMELQRLIKGESNILRHLFLRNVGPNVATLPDNLLHVKPMLDKFVLDFHKSVK